MEQYGGIQPTELNGDNVHRLENVLTLDSTPHWAFDELYVWLEPIVSAHLKHIDWPAD